MFTIIILVILSIVGIALLFSSFFIVTQQERAIIETLGKFTSIRTPGLNFKIPFFSYVVKTLDMKIQQKKETLSVKSQDNAFVRLPIAIQYQVEEGKEKEAFYNLSSPEEQIVEFIFNSIRSKASQMTIEELFSSKSCIEDEVKTNLQDKFKSYGYSIVGLIIDTPILSNELESSYNKVMSAQRELEAAKLEGESIKAKKISEAQAEGEALTIKSKSYADSRDIIAEGNAKSIKKLTEGLEGVSASDALAFIAGIDARDTIRDAAKHGNIIFIPATGTHSPIDLMALKTISQKNEDKSS